MSRGEPRRKKKGETPSPRKGWRWLLRGLALLALVGAGVAAHLLWQGFFRPYRGFEGFEHAVTIEPGTGARQILEQLADAGVLADARIARAWLVYVLDDPPLKAGEYRFQGPASGPTVLARLTRGEIVLHPVTLVEGLTLAETAERLARSGFGERDRYLALMSSPEPIADLDPEASDLEGYLFPETYHFAAGTSEDEIVAALVATFRRHYRETILPLLGDPPARTARELVTLASIVEKEARLDEERPLIAAVYANRLARGIGLYADPTVIYALKQAGRWDGNIRKGDLEIDSPYNTYRRAGLPPGPIASPGLASLRAAAAPAGVPYLYFVSKNDGSHVFAETLAEHNRNVERWQRRYWREKWAEEGGRK